MIPTRSSDRVLLGLELGVGFAVGMGIVSGAASAAAWLIGRLV